MKVKILLEKVSGGFVATCSHDGFDICEKRAATGELAVKRAKARAIELSEEDVEFEVVDLSCS